MVAASVVGMPWGNARIAISRYWWIKPMRFGVELSHQCADCKTSHWLVSWVHVDRAAFDIAARDGGANMLFGSMQCTARGGTDV